MKFLFLFIAVVYGFEVYANVAELRVALLARYAEVFAPRVVFDEQQVIALDEDTRSYFYEREAAGATDEDVVLVRLHGKLMLYLSFFQINIKARGVRLSDWNYYRLMLDALRTVDQRRIVTTMDAEPQHYYDLLYGTANANLWRALRMYQEHFPFLRWDFCKRFVASCPRPEVVSSWQSSEQVVVALNAAIERLNSLVGELNSLSRARFMEGNATKYQHALQDYLYAYERLLREPYGGILLLISERQQRRMLAAPAPFSTYLLAKLKPVDAGMVSGLFRRIAEMFDARLQRLADLYDHSNRQALMGFLFKYHRQAVAEFLVSQPQFFNIINHYLDVVNSEYEIMKKRTDATHRDSAFIIAGGAGLGYAALHHFFRFTRGHVLYFTALFGGTAATAYAALRQKSLVDVFTLREQVRELHNSLIMQQSQDLLHFLHHMGRLAQVRDDALLQGGMLTVYALFFVRHLRKAWSYRNFKHVSEEAVTSFMVADTDITYRGFSLRKVGEAVDAYPDLLRGLHITERLQLVENLFGNYPPFRAWQREAGTVRELHDLSEDQIVALWDISRDLQRIFEPSDGNIEEIVAKLDGTQATKRQVARYLDKVGFFLHRLFNIEHEHGIPPVR